MEVMSPVQTRLGCATVEIPLQQIWRHWMATRTIGCDFELALASGLSSVRVQKLAHPLLACSDTLLNQFSPDTRPAIGSFHLLEAGINVNKKCCIDEP